MSTEPTDAEVEAALEAWHMSVCVVPLDFDSGQSDRFAMCRALKAAAAVRESKHDRG